MKKLLNEILEYYKSIGRNEDYVKELESDPTSLAIAIMTYAHRNAYRENGENYANHPYRCFEAYRKLIGLNLVSMVNESLFDKYNIPYNGVMEVACMHDVIEDTDITIDDIANIYKECGYEEYFINYIKDALISITHNEEVDYEDYINICLTNPISALVKILDLSDNLNVISLNYLDEYRYNRACKYLSYINLINSKYHFLENTSKYREKLYEDLKDINR